MKDINLSFKKLTKGLQFVQNQREYRFHKVINRSADL